MQTQQRIVMHNNSNNNNNDSNIMNNYDEYLCNELWNEAKMYSNELIKMMNEIKLYKMEYNNIKRQNNIIIKHNKALKILQNDKQKKIQTKVSQLNDDSNAYNKYYDDINQKVMHICNELKLQKIKIQTLVDMYQNNIHEIQNRNKIIESLQNQLK